MLIACNSRSVTFTPFGYVGIDLAANFQTGFGGRRADRLDNDLVADERLATSVHGDEGEQAMLDLVPFAGAER
jgi:hypothetical protein